MDNNEINNLIENATKESIETLLKHYVVSAKKIIKKDDDGVFFYVYKALVACMKDYDSSKSEFNTYMTRKLKWYMYDYVQSEYNSSQLKRHQKARMIKLKKKTNLNKEEENELAMLEIGNITSYDRDSEEDASVFRGSVEHSDNLLQLSIQSYLSERDYFIFLSKNISGYTFGEIGVSLDISRQRVHQIYKNIIESLKVEFRDWE